MGIRLDWNVESDGGWEQIAEDPEAVAARKRRVRRVRNALLAVLALIAVGAGVVVHRLRQVQQQLRADLEATVAAETLALRIGDEEAFLDAQHHQSEWLQVQRRTFEQYQTLGSRLEVSGEIVEVVIYRDMARVVLRETLDGRAYHVTWFYHHDNASWRHIPSRAEFWDERLRIRTTHFDVIYAEPDQALAEAVSKQAEAWWETACHLTACDKMPQRITLRIEPEPLESSDAPTSNMWVVRIPSPTMVGIAMSGEIEPELFGRLASDLSGRWAIFAVEDLLDDTPLPETEVLWLIEPLQDWLHQAFDPSAPPSDFFSPLVEQYGPDIVPELMERLRQGEGVLPALRVLTGSDPLDLPVAWESYLEANLQAQMALVAEGRGEEVYEDQTCAGCVASLARLFPIPETFAVLGTQRVNDLLWVEVEFESMTRRHRLYMPLRVADDHWEHIQPTWEDWGEPLVDCSTHLSLLYTELDAPAVEGLLPYLEDVYGQLATDFGLTEDLLLQPQVQIMVTPFLSGTDYVDVFWTGLPYTPWMDDDLKPFAFVEPSPHSVSRWMTVTPEAFLRAIIVRDLVMVLMAEQIAPLSTNYPIPTALMAWEIERADAPQAVPMPGTGGRIGNEIDSLDDLWVSAVPAGSPMELWVARIGRKDYAAARALIDVVIETYGEEAIPRLVQYLGQAKDIDDWLFRSLGIHADEIEAQWRARVEENSND